MYVLYQVAYPEKTVSGEAVRSAWSKAGLDVRRLDMTKKQFGPEDVRGLVLGELSAARGARSGTPEGNLEVPDEKLALLESLERFYLALYPEMKDADYLRSFHFERLEWLGEY